MSCFLLLLLLFPVILASRAQPLLRQQAPSSFDCASSSPCEETVILKNGYAARSISSFFNLTNTDVTKAKDPISTVVDGASENIITSVYIGSQSAQTEENDNVVYSTEIVFNGFPGFTSLQITLEDSTGKNHTRVYSFFVVGIVLYEQQGDKPHILTGLNPNRTIVEAMEDGVFGTTVLVKSFTGNPVISSVQLDRIRFRVPNHSDILSWDRENCPSAADESSLIAPCSMAFSADFKEFSIRLEPGVEVTEQIDVEFEWEGIKDYQDDVNGEANVGVTDTEDLLDDDIITRIIVDREARTGNGRKSGPTALAGWKIGIIVIVSVLLLIAAITVVCCFGCGRRRSSKKPQPDVAGFKDKFQEIGFMRRVSTMRRGGNNMDDGDQCYVEEPPTPPDSEILMLENESRGHKRSGEHHIDGLIPMDRLNEDKSVEKLVLPPGVVRGVELESSTEGASGFGYGSPSGENDITSYGRGMTSVPRENFTKTRDRRSPRDRSSGSRRTDTEGSRDPDYFRDSHERIRSLERDRARIREIDREIERERSARERSDERMRSPAGGDEFMDSGPLVDDDVSNGMSRGRGGVDAAINRIRQLDLLNGPASRGLVGRNGEPIRRPGVQARLDGDASEVPSVS